MVFGVPPARPAPTLCLCNPLAPLCRTRPGRKPAVKAAAVVPRQRLGNPHPAWRSLPGSRAASRSSAPDQFQNPSQPVSHRLIPGVRPHDARAFRRRKIRSISPRKLSPAHRSAQPKPPVHPLRCALKPSAATRWRSHRAGYALPSEPPASRRPRKNLASDCPVSDTSRPQSPRPLPSPPPW